MNVEQVRREGNERRKKKKITWNWLRNRNTIEFLGLWEKLSNPDFKPLEFERFRSEAGNNYFVLSPQRWIESTNAIGFISKSGRYGGTYAHKDIAFEFASWISSETNKGMIWKAQTKDMDFADISNLRKSAQSVDKISSDNPQISQIRADYFGMNSFLSLHVVGDLICRI